MQPLPSDYSFVWNLRSQARGGMWESGKCHRSDIVYFLNRQNMRMPCAAGMKQEVSWRTDKVLFCHYTFIYTYIYVSAYKISAK